MDGLELHTNELRDIANSMKTEAENMRSSLAAATAKLGTLTNSYQGHAVAAFMQNYNSNLKPKFDLTCDKILSVADFIISSVDKYEQQDTENAQAASNLES